MSAGTRPRHPDSWFRQRPLLVPSKVAQVGSFGECARATESRSKASFGASRTCGRSTGSTSTIEPGEIYGFLGPNGAGKSTTVHMLTTLLPPTSGRATVAGFDVVREGAKVRETIGAALQEAALDPFLTGREHLRLQASLHAIRGARRTKLISALLDRVGLTHAGDRKVRTYSGGMKRRLDLALALIHDPVGAVPRRADDGPRPAEPLGAVGGGRPTVARGRRHGLPHDAVPRGGRRARRPRRDHRPRPHRRRGHARAAEGGNRAADGRGRAREPGRARPAARAAAPLRRRDGRRGRARSPCSSTATATCPT